MPALNSFLPLILMFAILYFLLIRPQQKQQKKRREMLSNLQKGDKIITIGGIYGEITNIREDRIFLKVAENVEIKVTRQAVGQKQEELVEEANKK